MTSTGLWRLAVLGRWLASVSIVSSLNLASSRPENTVMSVARIPGPPALVTMATRLPEGIFRRVLPRALSCL